MLSIYCIVFYMFLLYKAKVENKINKKIKWIRSDMSGEYVLFNEFCGIEGIIHEVTLPNSPESIIHKKKPI